MEMVTPFMSEIFSYGMKSNRQSFKYESPASKASVFFYHSFHALLQHTLKNNAL